MKQKNYYMNEILMKFIGAILGLSVLVLGCNAQSDEKQKSDEKPLIISAPLDKDKENPEIERLIDVGTDFVIAGKYDLAIDNFSKAIKLNPNFAEAYNHRGAAYSNKGDVDRAILDFTKALELKPNFYVALLNRSTAYATRKKYKLAIADYTKIIELYPTTVSFYLLRADAYDKIGRKDLAAADRKKAKKLKDAPE